MTTIPPHRGATPDPDVTALLLNAALAAQPLTPTQAETLLPLLSASAESQGAQETGDAPGGKGVRMVVSAAAMASSREGYPRRVTCGIINAKSGRCGEDCAFCAQSRYHATTAPEYPLVGEQVLLERAMRLADAGVTRMGIVTSGVGPSARDFENICRAARHIREQVGIGVCASLGVLREGQAEMLCEAGITSYHHNLETARSFYPRICTTHDYDIRVKTVRCAKAAGLRVCSGGLFGLGEGWKERLELSATLQELEVDSIPVNFLMPIPGTPLENAPGLAVPEALGLVALLRLMHPSRDIVLCGGRGGTLGEWDRLAVLAGANAIMVGDYLTAKGNALERDMRMLDDLRGVWG